MLATKNLFSDRKEDLRGQVEASTDLFQAAVTVKLEGPRSPKRKLPGTEIIIEIKIRGWPHYVKRKPVKVGMVSVQRTLPEGLGGFHGPKALLLNFCSLNSPD